MWIDEQFAVPDPTDVARQIVRDYPLAVIIAADPLRITHMPVIWTSDETGEYVETHIPLVDPISENITAGKPITVVVPGPDSYVSPEWYEAMGLPTYCLAPVHISGAADLLSREELAGHLMTLVTEHEAAHKPDTSHPWTPDEPATESMNSLLDDILGIRLPVTNLEVKVKAGQNRTRGDNMGTIDHLKDGSRSQRHIADLVRRYALTDE